MSVAFSSRGVELRTGNGVPGKADDGTLSECRRDTLPCSRRVVPMPGIKVVEPLQVFSIAGTAEVPRRCWQGRTRFGSEGLASHRTLPCLVSSRTTQRFAPDPPAFRDLRRFLAWFLSCSRLGREGSDLVM